MYIREVLAGNLSDQDVLGCLIDYFVGGVETTATTLYGFLLVLVQSQKMQKRLRADIDDVIGQDRQPHVQDKQSLPYVEACILELFRHQNSLPILIPRMVLQDTQLKGFHIPKGTWVSSPINPVTLPTQSLITVFFLFQAKFCSCRVI